MRKYLVAILCLLGFNLSYALQTLLYVDYHARADIAENVELFKQLQPYTNKIDIFAPSVYVMDRFGKISHQLAQAFIDWAHQTHILLMPLVINQALNQESIHAVLHSSKAEQTAIEELTALCQKNKYYGIQLDIEHISYKDRDAYTKFVQMAAQAFHENHFQLSVAVVPPVDYEQQPAPYQFWMYQNWVGGYDYAKLAQAADFISVMTYDHHTGLTAPGAIAPADWIKQTIQSLLKDIPADKFSLGIPAYSGHWYTNMRNGMPVISETPLSYRQVEDMVAQHKIKLSWSDTAK